MIQAAHDRFLAHTQAALSPAERLVRSAALQKETMARLEQSPAGWEHFLRRNLRKRAIRVPLHDRVS
jgi:hypothetical protein